MSVRDELIYATKKGIGFPVAGFVVITFAAFIVHLFPQKTALTIIFIATGAVFPIAMLASKLIKVDPFVKIPPLSNLGAILSGVQAFYWPVFILIFNLAPDWVPFTMAILFGSHFVPYGWLYKSKAYYFIGVVMPVVGCIVAFLGKDFSYYYTFAALVPVYAITCAMFYMENRALVAANPSLEN